MTSNVQHVVLTSMEGACEVQTSSTMDGTEARTSSRYCCVHIESLSTSR
jgi:hypothetical protein